ncbi:nucleotidyltransferase domain-containing protein [Vibrio parahaemolyticus]|uniref:nucleotidyltransferase domain-containing protein n=1 Tax=Vibrio parahaemolyticus TaxID=670 RepID=UPI0010EA1D8D|nr:nucleotidyltransferase domain-containing protein [Vibrio parahaemolyticus]EJG0042275.1 nucleotidyltransferase domain-containing protein [Vibrio parahaemolyticus]TBT32037.1 nucleotidyltransferase domain-containing protein [Vibrio parahaemolyticus]TOA02840.1 nucleotidyltransferase [Vibrio parahaemolyticus]
MDELQARICEELKNKYNPHTIILYGSYARNEANESSDIDVACFCDDTQECKDARMFHGVFLDAVVYPTAYLDSVPEEALRFGDGVVLYDERGLGVEYLSRVTQCLDVGRKPLSGDDVAHLREWVEKMLLRASAEDLDGNYRRTWLQYELLSLYFEVRGLWFLGSKKSFNYLKSQDKSTYDLFVQMYHEPNNLDVLRRLAAIVIRV